MKSGAQKNLILPQQVFNPSSLLQINKVHHRIFGRLHLVHAAVLPYACPAASFGYFQVGEDIQEDNCADPQAPPNLLMLHKFCELVDVQVLQNSHRSTALCASEDPSSRKQAALLLGAYVIMCHDLSPDEAAARICCGVASKASADFRNPFDECSGINVSLRDYLDSLHRSRSLGWISFAERGNVDKGDAGFDPEEYAYFDSPLNADLHEIVPGRLLLSSCPRDLPDGAAWADRYDPSGRFVARDFSPAFAADHLAQFDTALCVRVGVPRYGRDALDGTGLGLLDLFCEDAPVPEPAAVDRFLAAVDAAAPRTVALQGDGRRGPAAALAGAYLVRRHGFTGREAAAWLQMVRPGCVSGEHVRFLCAQEEMATAASVIVGVVAASSGAAGVDLGAGPEPAAAACRPWLHGARPQSKSFQLARPDRDDPSRSGPARDGEGGACSGLTRTGSAGRLEALVSWAGRGWGL